jgi:succinate-semialdehyde dehydrogenase / glutarate-semialdehyde dehydrogenase
MPIATINPATGELIQNFQPLSAADIDHKLELAVSVFKRERRTPFATRARRMLKAAEILERDKDKFARLMTLEMGKTLKSAVAEAVKCTTACRYYAENSERFMADEVVETGSGKSFVRYLPIGPILAVMPWNIPFWQDIRFAAPALMAGNVGLLKHASNETQ